MKQLRDLLFLLLCMGIGFGLVQGYRYWKYRTNYDFSQKGDHIETGLGDAPAARGFTLLAPPKVPLKPLFEEWKKLFATTVGVQYSPAWSAADLASTAKAAHAAHLMVVVVPPPMASEGDPYSRPLAEVAADAQAAGVDRLCISWLNTASNPDFWKQQAAAIRAVYKGKIILAATPEVFPKVQCWDVPDLVGVAGPIELPRRLPHASDDVSVHDLRVAWDCELTTFDSIGLLHKKPVALLNVEVPRDFAIKLSSPDAPPAKPREDVELQRQVYEALVLETKGRSERTDMLLLTWDGASPRAANQVPELLERITAAWDPKKPLPPESAPADTDAVDLDPADAAGTTSRAQ